MSDQQKTPWGVWFAAGLILLLLVYPLSIGPAAYFLDRVGEQNLPEWFLFGLIVLYYPVLWGINEGPEWISQPGDAYLKWWTELSG